jgi:hypothetical protein
MEMQPMRILSRRLAAVSIVLASAQAASAQTADEVITKSIAALGGRAAFAKVKTRSTVGTITLQTPAGEVTGSVELLNATPNKSRSLIKADLTSLGVGQLVLDQRFNGTVGYALDSLQGNREITGNQLDNLRNNSFPHPFLTYKELGLAVQLAGKEKVGDRDAFVLVFEPTSGSVVRQHIDAETYLPLRSVVKVEVPQLGGRQIEQTTEFHDYRDVDGIKLPFEIRSSSPIQNFTIAITKVEHNVAVDDALFSKPVAP